MLYIESESLDPYFNLALEEYAFETLSLIDDCFMLWQNDKTIVIGKNQNTAEEINSEYVTANDIKVARRMSGGGAVFHDIGNLNYTFIVKRKKKFDFNFKVFAEYVIDALKTLGIKAEFTGRNDIVIDGKKICGVAQYGNKDHILHHGCIMISSDLEKVALALKPKDAKFQSKSTKSVRSRVTTISAAAGRNITVQQFRDLLKSQILNSKGTTSYHLAKNELNAVQRLQYEKYETWNWNYGASPKYNFEVEHKFDFGLVSIRAQILNGRILSLSVFGDFFGNKDIAELTDMLKGVPLDDDLENYLINNINFDDYIKGMTPSEFCSMLL